MKKNGAIKIRRKRSGIIFLTVTVLFFWYLPQIRQGWQIRKEQEDAVQTYISETKEVRENEKEKNEEKRNREEQNEEEQKPDERDQNLFRRVDFAKLRLKNREIRAWIRIPGCDLDTPVVRGTDDRYYLTHNAFGEERIYGCIFAPCDTPEDFSERHIILFGHNMRDGTMFGGLKKYREASFGQKYPYLYLYLPGKIWRFRLVSVEETDAKSDVYRIGGWKERDWEVWLQERKENSLVSWSIDEKKLYKILTLSTCIGDGSSTQRLVVHAALEKIFETDAGRKEGSVLE